jgi:acyl-CoA synthetase (AMP-forming)/AMP-acid ligase II
LSSLEVVACGGAPLRKSVLELFKERFPNVHIAQVIIIVIILFEF